MQSISIKFLFSLIHQKFDISIPLLHKKEIENRVNTFIQTRPILKQKNEGLNRQRVLARDLFQRKDSEFFIFPYTNCNFYSEANINGNLMLLHNLHSDGIVLCFIPKDQTIRSCSLNKKIWIESNPLENLQDADFLSLSKDVVAVFCFKDGWISQNSNGQFVLHGIEIMILQTGGMQGFLCRKVKIESSEPERPLHNHPLSPLSKNSKFIKLSCFCRCEGFSFQVTLPVLTNFELQIELKTSHQKEWDSLSYLQEKIFFHREKTMHEAICFPDGMEMDLPFCGIKGWQLFFSFTEKANHFLCTFIPKISEQSILKTHKNYTPFCELQTGRVQYFQTMLHEVRPYCFNISQMSLTQKNNLEYCLEGGNVKLLSKKRTGLWGLFFSRQQKAEACFSEKKEAGSTATTSSLLGPARDSIEHQEKSSHKRLYPLQTPLVERPPSQSEDTSLLKPSASLFSIIEASPLAPLQPFVASMVQLHGNVARLEPLQLPPLPLFEPERSCQQQEEEKNKKLKTQSSKKSESVKLSVKFIFSLTYKISSLSIPLVSKKKIEECINTFVQTRPILKKPNQGVKRQRVLVKDLFQNKNNDFFVFPHTNCALLTETTINTGTLILLHNSHNDGIVLCFVPQGDDLRACSLNKKIWIKENPLEGLQKAEFFNLSKDVVSVFCFEDGWISQCSDGQFVLHGIEIIILQTGIMQGLLCKKVEVESSAPERPLQHHPLSPLPRNSKFIKLPCFCRCKGFSFQMTFPVLTSSELRIELKTSHREEWNSLSYPQEEDFFNTEETRHQAICFPDGMEMDFPFCGVKGWQLFFSFTEKPNHFLCVFLPKISERSILRTRKNSTDFCEWQTGISQYSQTTFYQIRPHCLNISQMSLIQKNSLEYCLKGGHVKLISKEISGLWGLFFSRKQKTEACFSAEKEVVSTATISSEKETIETAITSSLLSQTKGSIEHQEKSSRKRLYPFQRPFVERPPSQKDTSLLQPSPPSFSIIKASPLPSLQPLVASMVHLHSDIARLEPLQLPPMPFHEPERSWKQQEDVFTEVTSLEEMLALMDETKEEKEKALQKKSS